MHLYIILIAAVSINFKRPVNQYSTSNGLNFTHIIYICEPEAESPAIQPAVVHLRTSFPLPESPSLSLTGWWMVDANGMLGWAPASFLVPVDDGDLAEEAKENEQLMSSMRGLDTRAHAHTRM